MFSSVRWAAKRNNVNHACAAVAALGWLQYNHESNKESNNRRATLSVSHCDANNSNANVPPVAENAIQGSAPSSNPSTMPSPPQPAPVAVAAAQEKSKAGMKSNAQGSFHNLFPLRQVWQPIVPYPLWDEDWDGKALESTGNEEADRQRERLVRRNGVTRHLILIRHGQYDETHKEDEKRILTPLGRQQAELTGQRLAALVRGVDEQFGPCHVKILRVSDMARAKETASIIAKHLEGVEVAPPDSDLNEGRPAHNIPGGKARLSVIEKTDECHPRIETAFQRYFYRSQEDASSLSSSSSSSSTPPPPPPPEANVSGDDNPQNATTTTTTTTTPTQPPSQLQQQQQTQPPPQTHNPNPKHEFEIIVGHANVIRYFFCRALQLPPEAWLRLCIFNCSLTYLTIRPTGTVSCRMLGDIGHLGYGCSTFSMHHGFNW